MKPKEVIAKLYAAHSEGKTNMGFDIEGESGEIKVVWRNDYWVETEMILHILGLSGVWGIRLACCQEVGPQVRSQRRLYDSQGEEHTEQFLVTWIPKVNACHVTQVDQIIMAKRAGGPKPRDTSGGMDQDDD